MAQFIRVAHRDAIAEGAAKVVEVNGRKIALFYYSGRLYAIANECRHEGASLGDGDVYGTRVVCPLHGWEYDFTTGCNVDDPSVTLRRYAVKLDGDDVLIEL